MVVIKDIVNRNALSQTFESNKLVVLFFWAEWSEPCKALQVVAEALSNKFSIDVLKVEAEKVEDVSSDFNITVVPSFIILKGSKELDRVDGADPASLTQKLSAAVAKYPSVSPLDRVRSLVEGNDVLLAMKGSATAPRCGFSRRVVACLLAEDVKFVSVDILQDEELRTAFKEFASWPTYPQLYVKGEFVGGCDIVEEMAANGELKELLKLKLGPESFNKPKDIMAHVKSLVESAPVMLFMKGSPELPRCGFSGRVVSALKDTGIPFKTFDILSDQEVRENLKKFANWPTYPQLYVKGELVGGCDIITELSAAGELTITIEDMLKTK
uniref:Glutaredoxin n=1 Tax=Polytomella parva TaxID=51329 RepID=A0A7S0VBN1_9CHLO|mmetsp:Transcript_323/g.346  ORF Transcript_323/g.346 Transcript_323/m.346 type:complete len:327 (+) Transcript_323:56-1036(+)